VDPQHGDAPHRPAQAVRDLRDRAVAQRAHAVGRRVVQQPEQPPVGHGEQRARARPRRGRRDERDVLVVLEGDEQLAPERAAQRLGQPRAGGPLPRHRHARDGVLRRGRLALPRPGAQHVVGGVDLRHARRGGRAAAAVGVPALRQAPVRLRGLLRGCAGR
jgi:hypothetical protein